MRHVKYLEWQGEDPKERSHDVRNEEIGMDSVSQTSQIPETENGVTVESYTPTSLYN